MSSVQFVTNLLWATLIRHFEFSSLLGHSKPDHHCYCYIWQTSLRLHLYGSCELIYEVWAICNSITQQHSKATYLQSQCQLPWVFWLWYMGIYSFTTHAFLYCVPKMKSYQSLFMEGKVKGGSTKSIDSLANAMFVSFTALKERSSSDDVGLWNNPNAFFVLCHNFWGLNPAPKKCEVLHCSAEMKTQWPVKPRALLIDQCAKAMLSVT